MKEIVKEHAHSIIMAVVIVLSGYPLEAQLYALLITFGIFVGREHSQAEYRYMAAHKINRAEMPALAGFYRESWNAEALINDLAIPVVVGVIVINILAIF